MRHNRRTAAAEQPEPVVCVAVKSRLRAELLHPLNFRMIFRQVRLHRQPRRLLKRAQSAHQLVGARRDKTRRQNGRHIFEFAGAAFQPAPRLAERNGRALLAQAVGTVAVHVDLADHRADTRPLQQLHQTQRSRHMNRREHTGTRRRAARQRVGEQRVSAFCVIKVTKPRLLRKGVRLQPVEQFEIHAKTTKGILRRMQVQVNQSRYNQFLSAVLHMDTVKLLRQPAKHAGRTAVFTDGIALLHNSKSAGSGCINNITLEGEGFFVIHPVPPVGSSVGACLFIKI